MLYPFLMQPYYRHGTQTPWGGDSLRMLFGKDIPDDKTGESLEISGFAPTPSTVVNGEFAGRTLDSLQEELGTALSGVTGEFPLMAKLIDARDKLSVQVHPGDEYAKASCGKLGKTEAWLVVQAERGSFLYAGLKENAAPFAELCGNEEAMQAALQEVPVRPGDVLYIPHGLVHALREGIMVYEIQQSSDLTYRISDWGRMGLDGKPRALHLADAAAVVRQELRAEKSAGASLVVEGGVRTVYVCDDRFALWRLNCSGNMPLEEGKILLLTALTPCTLAWEGGELPLSAGASVVVPAQCPRTSIRGRAHVLMSTLPDKQALRTLLGARAANVAGLCEE